MVEEHLSKYEEIIENKVDFDKYPTFGNLDYFNTCDITYKIASRLFSMNKDDRSIYAKLIIELLEIECSTIGLYDYKEEVEYYQKQTGENAVGQRNRTDRRACDQTEERRKKERRMRADVFSKKEWPAKVTPF